MQPLKIFMFISFMVISGCAGQGQNKQDPWEGWNRGVYKFNRALDNSITKPLTKGYKAITPDFVETGVSNVFNNLDDVPNMLNNFLQGKLLDSLSDLARLIVNSTIGIGGIFDFASDMGLDKHDEDFGQTLGAWGVGSGPYMMLPLLGPSTLRDLAAYPADSATNPINQIDHIPTRNQISFLELLDTRSGFMKYESQLEEAHDEYVFLRDFYLQNRKFRVLDGDIPFEEEECEDEDEDECDW